MVKHKLFPTVQVMATKTKKNKNLIILDRDGTINRDFGYTYKLSDLFILNKNIDIIKKFIKVDTTVVCATNQSGIGRGYFSLSDAKLFNESLSRELNMHKILIQAFYMCPHTPDSNCQCRKPNTLMLEMAIKYSGTSNARTIFIGDSESDQAACTKLGIKFIKVIKNDL